MLPSRFASLLLQYKRPTLWYGASAPLFAVYQGPYYRFEFRSSQHRTLVRLDEALQDEALVRYAAPCTQRRTDLEQWQMDRTVLEHTNFVSPRRVGLRHKAWTYQLPGQVGRRNEFTGEDDALLSDSASAIFGNLRDRPQAPTLNQHLSLMLQRLGGQAADERVEDVVRGLGLDNADLLPAIAAGTRLLLLGLELAPVGVSWWLVEAH